MMEFVSWDDEIPNMMGQIKHVPNHQPGNITNQIWGYDRKIISDLAELCYFKHGWPWEIRTTKFASFMAGKIENHQIPLMDILYKTYIIIYNIIIIINQ
jgi:hypothetical protein